MDSLKKKMNEAKRIGGVVPLIGGPDSGALELLELLNEQAHEPFPIIDCQGLRVKPSAPDGEISRVFASALSGVHLEFGVPIDRFDRLLLVALKNIDSLRCDGLQFAIRCIEKHVSLHQGEGKCVVVTFGKMGRQALNRVIPNPLVFESVEIDSLSEHEFSEALLRGGYGSECSSNGWVGFAEEAVKRTAGRWGLLNRLIHMLSKGDSFTNAFGKLEMLPDISPSKTRGSAKTVHRIIPTGPRHF